MAVLNRCYEGLYLAVVALRIDLVVGQCGNEVVMCIEVFDGFIMFVDFFEWDTEKGGGLWLEGKFLHLREAVNTL